MFDFRTQGILAKHYQKQPSRRKVLLGLTDFVKTDFEDCIHQGWHREIHTVHMGYTGHKNYTAQVLAYYIGHKGLAVLVAAFVEMVAVAIFAALQENAAAAGLDAAQETSGLEFGGRAYYLVILSQTVGSAGFVAVVAVVAR